MTKEIFRIVPTDSWGKHVLEIFVDGNWEWLSVDYLEPLENMKAKIEAAYKPVPGRNTSQTASCEVVHE